MYPERIHRGIEWNSVFETSVCVFFVVGKFSHFYTVQYRRVQYSTDIYCVLNNTYVFIIKEGGGDGEKAERQG